jgi:hypothetical protein
MECNMGGRDRYLRIFVSSIILFCSFLFELWRLKAGIVLMCISVSLVVTTVFRFCPLYTIFNFTTLENSKEENESLILQKISAIFSIISGVNILIHALQWISFVFLFLIFRSDFLNFIEGNDLLPIEASLDYLRSNNSNETVLPMLIFSSSHFFIGLSIIFCGIKLRHNNSFLLFRIISFFAIFYSFTVVLSFFLGIYVFTASYFSIVTLLLSALFLKLSILHCKKSRGVDFEVL